MTVQVSTRYSIGDYRVELDADVAFPGGIETFNIYGRKESDLDL